jgi:hypothetical protein
LQITSREYVPLSCANPKFNRLFGCFLSIIDKTFANQELHLNCHLWQIIVKALGRIVSWKERKDALLGLRLRNDT